MKHEHYFVNDFLIVNRIWVIHSHGQFFFQNLFAGIPTKHISVNICEIIYMKLKSTDIGKSTAKKQVCDVGSLESLVLKGW